MKLLSFFLDRTAIFDLAKRQKEEEKSNELQVSLPLCSAAIFFLSDLSSLPFFRVSAFGFNSFQKKRGERSAFGTAAGGGRREPPTRTLKMEMEIPDKLAGLGNITGFWNHCTVAIRAASCSIRVVDDAAAAFQ